MKDSTNRMELTPGTATWAYPSNLKLQFCHLDWRTSAKINFVTLPKVVTKDPSQKALLLKLLFNHQGESFYFSPS